MIEFGGKTINIENLSKHDVIHLLSLSEKSEIEKLYNLAYNIKVENVGKVVYFRGIIELSNICEKNCYYCGIRKENKLVDRYFMEMDELLEAARFILDAGYGSLVIQSGERTDNYFIDFIEESVKKIKELSSGKLGITLSCGEQTEETYKKWFDAGAHRYLLRIETTDPFLYSAIHPEDHSHANRLTSLDLLKNIGYQVGTGVMIGLPGQTVENLADDIIFFKNQEVDMIGMGPYIPHKETPMGKNFSGEESEKLLELSLKMIAVTRIFLKEVNIASTTALQAINHFGREMGLKAGANIIMPNATETKYRSAYSLYDNKPCTDENMAMCRGCLEKRIASIGETIGYNEWGDSRRFTKRTTIISE